MQGLKGLEVIRLDQHMPGGIRELVLDAGHRHQCGEDRLAKLTQHYEFIAVKLQQVSRRFGMDVSM